MKQLLGLALALAIATPLAASPAPAGEDPAIAGLAAVYQRIAEAVVATKNSEAAIVRAIVQMSREHATAALDRAKTAAPGAAAAELRTAAARIGDFATEGGSAVEPIRNKLLEAGHHHNADDTGPTAEYDTGYVLLAKKQKAEALELAKRCAKAAESGKADAAEITAIRDALTALAAKVMANK